IPARFSGLSSAFCTSADSITHGGGLVNRSAGVCAGTFQNSLAFFIHICYTGVQLSKKRDFEKVNRKKRRGTLWIIRF
ncbi:MAG: hypothetical protein IKZ66_05635, partial [Schwartzia sp.]|nr:hypothetical protein [Schwartzia sp. (in: firmicutes)]